jgi:tetratricopeptide (TPR) repeat protein
LVAAPVVRAAAWGPVEARPVGQFVGRRRLQRHLPMVVDGDEYAGVVLHGIGGIGKTTLAAQVLERVTQADPGWRVATLFGEVTVDGLLAEVATVARRALLVRGTPTGEQAVAVQVAGRVDVPWPDRFALLREHVLSDVPVLVVLDNFEDNLTPTTSPPPASGTEPDGGGWPVTDEALADLLTAWVGSPGRSRLLITSRQPIRWSDGARGRVFVQPVGPLSAAETGKLLWSLPQVDRHADTESAVDRVWRLVGGHPRSLEYLDALLGQGRARFDDVTDRMSRTVTARLEPEAVAAWLTRERTLDVALADAVTLIADEVLLTDHLRRLAQVPGAVEALAAVSAYREPVPVMALGFHLGQPTPPARIDAQQQARQHATDRIEQLLARHGLGRDGLTDALQEKGPLPTVERETLQELLVIAGKPPVPPLSLPDGSQAVIQMLADSSLIHHDPDTDTVFMHRWTATELHSHWTTTDQTAPDLVNDAHQAAAAYRQWRVDAWPQDTTADLHDRSEARYHLIAAGMLDEANTLTEHICRQLDDWGAWDQETSLIHDTLRWLPTDSPRQRAHIHQLGVLAQYRGDYPEAERRYQQALTIDEGLGDQAGMAIGYHQLGMLAQYRGDYPEAERLYQQSLTIEERLGNQDGVASSYGQLGLLAQLRGDYPEAERRFQQALTIEERLGNQAGMAIGYHNLGVLAQYRGDYPEAEHRYQQSLTIKERLGNQAGMATSYHQLGILAQAREDYPEAERRYQQSLTINERLGNQAGMAASYHQLGILAQLRGDYLEAERRYQQSLTIEERLGNQAGMATSYSQLGILHAATGNPTNAIAYNIRALIIRLNIGAPQSINDLERLRQLRTTLGSTAFAQAAQQQLDENSYDILRALFDKAAGDE